MAKQTKTRAFGSSSRESHDASAFYNSRLYEEFPEDGAVGEDTDLPESCANKIFGCSSEKMADLPEGSVHLMVTSPPYNVGKEYDRDYTLDEYLAFLRSVWEEVYRVLAPGGRACVNVANVGRKPYIPLHAFIIEDMLKLGFRMRGEVIWNKASGTGASTAWGSWKSASNPTLRDIHEYILIFSKASFRRISDRESSISRDEFLETTKSVWTFSAESARKIGHPAPLPMELPYRLIQLLTFEDDVVLDPFMGSGQTALAAVKSGRRYVGYEIDEDYRKLAEGRIEAFAADLAQNT